MPKHHPDYEYPHWTLDVKNNLFHQTLTVVQRMKATTENLVYIHNLIVSLFYEYTQKIRILDEYEDLQMELEWENTEK